MWPRCAGIYGFANRLWPICFSWYACCRAPIMLLYCPQIPVASTHSFATSTQCTAPFAKVFAQFACLVVCLVGIWMPVLLACCHASAEQQPYKLVMMYLQDCGNGSPGDSRRHEVCFRPTHRMSAARGERVCESSGN